ncbi:MAG: TlyA family RNA methyltransferase [Clostridia bacterium]|nr:TlyA family RNA methyltransferase [Clostridia bacterium]
MRLDVYLVQSGLSETRERAQELIRNGSVLCNGRPCKKNSTLISDTDKITLISSLKYVGRGGYKLEKALQVFSISLEGKTVLDVGASTGGFTDCSLQNGAKEVFAVDVGHDQLAPSLREDPRVHNLQGVHVKDLANHYSGTPDFICVDISFLSLEKVLPHLVAFSTNADLVVLVKPQFEVRHKKSVIRDPKVHREVLRSVVRCAEALGYTVCGLDFSPVKGTEGNIEYLLHLSLSGVSSEVDISSVIHAAQISLK